MGGKNLVQENIDYTVEAKANSHHIDDEFDHLIVHALACTLENENVSGIRYGRISFGSLDEMIIRDGFDEGNTVLKEGVDVCPIQGKARGERCMTKAIAQHEDSSCSRLAPPGQAARCSVERGATPKFSSFLFVAENT